MIDLPLLFVSRMKRLLGEEEFAAFQEALRSRPQIGLRVNTLKISPQDFAARSPFALEPVPWCPAGFRVVDGSRPGKHPYHAAGLYYLQEPSAMTPAEVLAPRPGERVLDLAAAPGGKTTHLASLMRNEGLLVANDVQPKRVHEMTNNLDRWGARNIAVLVEQPRRLAERLGAFFDRVLLDAPCSGEGMFRKDYSARKTWTPNHVARCARIQAGLIHTAARLVRPGGYLLYSTCTFAPEEDEGTIGQFLEKHPEFEVVALEAKHGFEHARPEWADAPPAVAGALRLWPHKIPGEGHFIALLRRRDDAPPATPPALRPAPPKGEMRALYDRFVEESLRREPAPRSRLAVFGNRLYALPEGLPDLKGLRVERFGWWLGTFKTGRFEPVHSLALAIEAEDAVERVNFAADDPDARRYLHREPLPSPGPDGWVLVTVDGFPLGWAKRVQGTLKSRAPRWLGRV